MPDLTFELMLDTGQFREKPTKVEAGAIRKRLKEAQPSMLTLDALSRAIGCGQLFTPGVMLYGSSNECWQRQQVFAVDIDNQTGTGEDRHRITETEGYLTPEDAQRICEAHRLRPALAYYSFSDKHDAADRWHKFRLVFIMNRVISDRHEREQLSSWLVSIFGTAADESCTDPARLFFGSRNGSVFIKEPVVCDTDVILQEAEIERQIAAIEEEAERKAASERSTALPGYNPEDYNADPEKLLHMIDPNALPYKTWLSVCSSFKAAGGSREAWLAWCDLYNNNDPKESADMYDGCNKGTNKPTTGGTLKFWAQKMSPDAYKQYMDVLDAAQQAAIESARRRRGGDSGPFTIERLSAFLDEHGISCRYNEVLHRIEFSGMPERYDSERTTAQAPTVIISMLKAARVKGVSIQTIADYLDVIATQRRFNPVRELLQQNKWDGRSRVNDLIEAMRLPPEDSLSRVLLRKWMRQAIALCLLNDHKRPFGADGILVLTGPQGIGKTTLARVLGISPELFKGGLAVDPRDKDSMLKATSCFIAEIGELESTLRRDLPALKAFLTAETDEIRRPYGRATETHVRRTSFIATCNSDDFLLDTTGNRRFWTIPCGDRFDIDALLALDPVQIWAEVYAQAQVIGPMRFRLTSAEQEQLAERNGEHMTLIPAEAEVRDILSRAKTEIGFQWADITVTQFRELFPAALRQYTAKQIGQALNACGIEKKQIRINGEPTRCRRLPVPQYALAQQKSDAM